jgi:tetratricopeptide (TPR) repeat protein
VRWSKGKEVSRVRITPQLIKVSDDTHLWADRYDRTLEDIFDVQSDIAEKVIEQLNMNLLAPEKDFIQSHPTDNMDAYNAYLRAKDFLNRPGYEAKNTLLAIDMYQRAIKLDSGFTQAYALLSIAHTRMFFFGHDTTTGRIELAREYLDKAKSQDASVAEVYLAEASYYYHIEREYDRAIQAARIAAKTMPIEPNDILFAMYRRQGKLEKALEKIKFILSLNPTDINFITELGITYSAMNDFEKAEKHLLRSESLAPDQENSYGHLMFVYIRKNGDVQKFKEVIERMPNAKEEDWTMYYGLSGQYEKALENLLKHNSPDVDQQPLYIPGQLREAELRYALGEEVAGSEYLKKAIEIIEGRTKESPRDYRLYVSLGKALALNNEREKALNTGTKSIEIMPLEKDWMAAPQVYFQLAEMYIYLGEFNSACDQLEILFSNNTYVTPPWIKAYWTYNKLREFPRYKRLMETYDRSE